MAQAAERDGAGGRNYNTMRLRATGLDPAHPGEGTQGRVEMWLFLDGREGGVPRAARRSQYEPGLSLNGVGTKGGVQGGWREENGPR